jgi:thiol:disulfide interchange protein DsbA
MNHRVILAAALMMSLFSAGSAVRSASEPLMGPPPVSAMKPSGIAWKEGENYEVLATTPSARPAAAKVEVLEFFQYGCPHCYTMEPHATLWRIMYENLATVKRVPVMFRPKLRSFARLYYTLEVLGRIDERGPNDLNHEVFDQLLRVQKPLTSDDEQENFKLQLDFATSRGIDAAKFTAAYHSAAVEQKLRRAEELANTYRITSTPTFIVGGKYKTDIGAAGDEYRLMHLLADLSLKSLGR